MFETAFVLSYFYATKKEPPRDTRGGGGGPSFMLRKAQLSIQLLAP